MTGISDRILDPDYILAEVVSRSKNFSLAPRIVETFREFLGYNFREHTYTHSLPLSAWRFQSGKHEKTVQKRCSLAERSETRIE